MRTSLLPWALSACALCACGENTLPSPGCGDGVAGGTEQCDGQDLAGQTCLSLGYLGGDLGCSADCRLETGACADPSTYLATWNTECGNGVCEIDEAGSSCPADCVPRTLAETPFALHAASAPQAEELGAGWRVIVRLDALADPRQAFQVADATVAQTSTRVIATLVSGAEVAEHGFRYCLPTGDTLAAWRGFVGRAVERYDGDADLGCALAGPDCYEAGDGLYPDPSTIAALQVNPIKHWQIENEWFWQVDDCSGAAPVAPSPATLATHLQALSATIHGADGDARVILGALASVTALAALEWPGCYRFVEAGGDDCAYREILPGDVTPQQRQLLEQERARVVETLRLGDPHFDIVDSHFYRSRPHAMLYEAVLVQRLLAEAGVTRPVPLWSLENAGPYHFFPGLGVEQPTSCPAPPATPEEMADSEYGGPYSDALLADHVAMHYAVGTLAGFEKIAWSSLHPTLGWGEAFLRTALLDYDLEEKPAYHTYVMLARELGELRAVDKPLPEVYRFALADGGVKLLVWSNAGVTEVDVSDLVGEDTVSLRRLVRESSAEPAPVTADSHAVPVGPSPVLVEGR